MTQQAKRLKRLQYTVRNVPSAVDRALRRRARNERKSLNQVLLEALAAAAGAGQAPELVFHDLDHLSGKWVEDPGFDEAIAAQDEVDVGAWK